MIPDEEIESLLEDHQESEEDDASFIDLVEGAGKWIKNMMDNKPDALPPTFMVKLYLDGKKAIASRAVEPESDEGRVSILDRIDALPREHAVAILKGELARLDSLRDEHFAALNRLQGDTNGE